MEIILRPWQRGDLEALARHANDRQVAAQLRNTFPHPYTREDAAFYLALCEQAEPDKNLMLAVTADGEAVGGVSLMVKDDVNCKCGELGYWLGRAHWGQGIATAAVRQVTETGFSAYGLVRIYAECFADNAASARVLEKNGFQLEGRLRSSIYKYGKISDSLLYAKIRQAN